jgi:hypothetical protein
VKELPEFLCLTSGKRSIWIDRLLAETELLRLLNSPDRLLEQADCEIIKDQTKIKIGRLSLTIDGRRRTVYIKRYNAFSWRRRVASLLFVRSGGVAALRGGAILKTAGISVARPLAAVESRGYGSPQESFFISEEIDGGRTVDNYWVEELTAIPGPQGYRRRRIFLRGLAGLLSRLHEHKIYHNDLKDANIVIRVAAPGGDGFFLLDLEGVRRCWYVSGRRRIKNLVQLNRTLGKFLSQTQKLFFLDAYLGSNVPTSQVRRRWIRHILDATARADRRFSYKTARPRAPMAN